MIESKLSLILSILALIKLQLSVCCLIAALVSLSSFRHSLIVCSCWGPDSDSIALNSKNAYCLSIGYRGSVLVLRDRDIVWSIYYSSAACISSSWVTGKSSNSCIFAISSSRSFEISIFDTGLASLGATPSPNPPKSMISPAPSPLVFYLWAFSLADPILFWLTCSSAASRLLFSYFNFLKRLRIWFKNSFACLTEVSESMSSISPVKYFRDVCCIS